MLAEAGWGIVQRTVSGVSNAVTIVIGLAVMPFFLFYVLKDRERVVGGLYPLMSERGRTHTRNVISIANGVIGSYVRGQLMSATVVGVWCSSGCPSWASSSPPSWGWWPACSV